MRFLVELLVPYQTCQIQRHRNESGPIAIALNAPNARREIVAEYQDAHGRTKHVGKKAKFTFSRAPNQSQLGFTVGDETMTNMVKCSEIDALVNIERAYANSVVNNDMDCIINIFDRRNGRL